MASASRQAALLFVLWSSLQPSLVGAKAPRSIIDAREIIKALGLSIKDAATECEFRRAGAHEAKDLLEQFRKAELKQEATPMVLLGVANWTSKSMYKSATKMTEAHGELAVKGGDAGAIQAFGGRPSVTQKWPLKKVLGGPHPRGYVAFSDLRRRGKETHAHDKFLAGVEVSPHLSDFGEDFVLSIGHDGTGLSPHVHGDTYLTLLQGKKLWLLQPPAQAHWAPRHAAFAKELKEKGRPPQTKLCIQRPGETVFVPAGWGHATVNVGLSVGIGQQEPPGFMPGFTLQENPRNIHTLLRASMAAADIEAAKQHVEVVLEEDPDNVEALTMLAQAATEMPDVSSAEKRETCSYVVGRLKTWLSENDPDDELAGAGLEYMAEVCKDHLDSSSQEL